MRLLVLSFNWMSDESFGMSDCYKAYVYTPTLLSFNWMSDESFGMSDCYKDYCLNSYTPELL